MAGEVWIGTSGWSYKHWTGGVFYPPKLPARLWLPHYAETFSTVEINASFYRLPKRETVQAWRDTVPGGFLFAVKMWRAVTHYHRLEGTGELLDRFFESMGALGDRFGPLLVQTPPGLRLDLPLLDSFLGELVQRHKGLTAFEFRSKTWLTAEVLGLLAERGAALVVHDMKGSVNKEAGQAPFVYVRRHGPGNWGRYTSSDIDDQASQVRLWLSQGRDVFVYFNNDAHGWAIENALELRKALSATGKPLAGAQP